jgi:hypothetical protein
MRTLRRVARSATLIQVPEAGEETNYEGSESNGGFGDHDSAAAKFDFVGNTKL